MKINSRWHQVRHETWDRTYISSQFGVPVAIRTKVTEIVSRPNPIDLWWPVTDCVREMMYENRDLVQHGNPAVEAYQQFRPEHL